MRWTSRRVRWAIFLLSLAGVGLLLHGSVYFATGLWLYAGGFWAGIYVLGLMRTGIQFLRKISRDGTYIRRVEAGLCGGCGYDLRGHVAGGETVRCPECGTYYIKPAPLR